MNKGLEMSFKINEEQKEALEKTFNSGGVRHYLLELANDNKLDVVEYKEYQDLQQRIDRIIKTFNEHKKFCESKLQFEKNIHSSIAKHNETYWKYCIKKIDCILSILKGENNE